MMAAFFGNRWLASQRRLLPRPRPHDLWRFLRWPQAHRYRQRHDFSAWRRNGDEISRFRHRGLRHPGPALSARGPAGRRASLPDAENDRRPAAFDLLEAWCGVATSERRERNWLARGSHPALRNIACRGVARSLRVVVSVRGSKRGRFSDG